MTKLQQLIKEYKNVCATYPQTARTLNISIKLMRQIEKGYIPKPNKVQSILERAEIAQTTLQDAVLEAFEEYENKKSI